jgi:hypothetical protein
MVLAVAGVWLLQGITQQLDSYNRKNGGVG